MRIFYTNQFKKDYKSIKKQKKNLKKLKVAIEKLLIKKQLEWDYKDHPLFGNWKGFRDCHLEPDWILIYKVTEEALILERTGTPSELFKK